MALSLRMTFAAVCLFLILPLFSFQVLASDTLNNEAVFSISEHELKELVQKLAPKVNLFHDIWEKDPEAVFFGGTSRDFIYWILGHFRNIHSRSEINKIKKSLLKLPFIDIRKILHFESDIDFMTRRNGALPEIQSENYAIRKIDSVPFDRFDPTTELGKNEIDQGSIPIEKIRLGRNGIFGSDDFGNGLSEILSGHLSISIPDPLKYRETYYAKKGLNHPVLLALRYIRNLSQDYLHRFGDGFPSLIEKQRELLDPGSLEWVTETIEQAMTDPAFQKILENKQVVKWLAGSIRKAFRGFSNSSAAFHWFRFFKVEQLQRIYSNKIPSLHEYLLDQKWDEKQIRRNWEKMKSTAAEASVLVDPKSIFDGGYLYHGAGSDEAFRSLIFQGAIPSNSGSAGSGFYGVPISLIEMAERFAENGGDKKRIVKTKIKENARIVDITKGHGKRLFEVWLQQQNSEIKNNHQRFDQFAEAFGIDMILYDYQPFAAVVKNRRALGKFEGHHYQLLTLDQIIELAQTVATVVDLHRLLEIFSLNQLNRFEVQRVLSQIPSEKWTSFEFTNNQLETVATGDPILFSHFLRFVDFYGIKQNRIDVWRNVVERMLQILVQKLTRFIQNPIDMTPESIDLESRLVENISGLVVHFTEHLKVIFEDKDLCQSIFSSLNELSSWCQKLSRQLTLPLASTFVIDLFLMTGKANPSWVVHFGLSPVAAISESSATLSRILKGLDQRLAEEARDAILIPLMDIFFSNESIEYSLKKMEAVFLDDDWRTPFGPEFWKQLAIRLESAQKVPWKSVSIGRLIAEYRVALSRPEYKKFTRKKAIQLALLFPSLTGDHEIGFIKVMKNLPKILSSDDDIQISRPISIINLVVNWFSIKLDAMGSENINFNRETIRVKYIFEFLNQNESRSIWKQIKTNHFAQRFFATYIMNQKFWIEQYWDDILQLAKSHKTDRELIPLTTSGYVSQSKKKELLAILNQGSEAPYFLAYDQPKIDREFQTEWNNILKEIRPETPMTPTIEEPSLAHDASAQEVYEYLETMAIHGFPFREDTKPLIIKTLKDSREPLFVKYEKCWTLIDKAADLEGANHFFSSLPWLEILGVDAQNLFLDQGPLPRGSPTVALKGPTAGQLGIEIVQALDFSLLAKYSNPYRKGPAAYIRSKKYFPTFLQSREKLDLNRQGQTHLFFKVDPRAQEGIDFKIQTFGSDADSSKTTHVQWLTGWALSPEINLAPVVSKKIDEMSKIPKFALPLAQAWNSLTSQIYHASFPRLSTQTSDPKPSNLEPFERLISYGSVNRELSIVMLYSPVLSEYPHLLERLIKGGNSDYEIDSFLRYGKGRAKEYFREALRQSNLPNYNQALTVKYIRNLIPAGVQNDPRADSIPNRDCSSFLEEIK